LKWSNLSSIKSELLLESLAKNTIGYTNAAITLTTVNN